MKRSAIRSLLLLFIVPCALGFQFLSLGGNRKLDAVAMATCPDNAGRGGATATLASGTRGGDGCVVFEVDGDLTTFIHTGSVQSWTVPSAVTSVTIHLIGAGGGGGRSGTASYGGGGGYATAVLNVTPGQTFDVVVGGGGIRQCRSDVPLLSNETARRNVSFGGGASGNGSASYDCSFAAGGGRSAVRISGTSIDVVTAGGGGGGGYSGAGGAGGGLTGTSGGGTGGAGGSQTVGGASASPEPGVAGVQYAGGWAGFSNSVENPASEGGGGGGGYFGGGGGGDNGGGGGGSSFLGALTAASTVAGSGREAGIDPPVETSSPSIATRLDIGAIATATVGTWTHGGVSTFQWQLSSDNVTFTDIAGATANTYLPEGPGYLRVVETRRNFLGAAVSYSNVAAVADTTLSALSVSSGMLTPSFVASQRAYTVSVPFRTRSVKVTPVASANNAIVTVGGVAVAAGSSSGGVDLAVGSNSIVLVVSVGVSSTTTNISVQRAAASVPGRPTIDDIVAADGSVTVAFTAPADDGGDDITSYEYSLDGRTWSTVIGNGKFTVSGLTNGLEAVVEIRAVNSAGAGTVSVGRSATPVAPTTTSSTTTTTVATTTSSVTTTSSATPTSSTTDVRREADRRAATTTTRPTADGTTTSVTSIPADVLPTSTVTTAGVIDSSTTTSTAAESGSMNSAVSLPSEKLTLVPHIAAGRMAAGSDIEARAEGLAPNTPVFLELHSAVRLLAKKTAGADGTTSFDVRLPDDIETGVHMLVLRGESVDGAPVAAVAPFVVAANGLVDKVLPVSVGSVVPDEAKLARMVMTGAEPYDPASDFSGVVALATAAVVVMGVAGGSRSKSSPDESGDSDGPQRQDEQSDDTPQRDEDSAGSLSSADAKYLDVVGSEDESWGDRSRLWRTPGWTYVHALLRRLVGYFDNKSTLTVRLLQDGTWVRAGFGALGVLPWAAGAVLGVVSSFSVDQMALPPSLGFVVAIVALAFVDALAGAVAWITFTFVVLTNGNVDSWFDLRTLLGLGVLFACLPIIGAAIRPILRPLVGGRHVIVQRVGDYFMMPIFLGYAAASVYRALNGLSGLEVVPAASADVLRNICFMAAVIRLLAEDVSTRAFPRRRGDVEVKVQRTTGAVVAHFNVALLWAIFLLTASPYFGLGWRTWLVVTLMSIVPLAKIHKGSFPNVEFLHRWFPRGILRAAIMLFVGAYYGRWIEGVAGNAADARALAPFLLFPGVAIGLIDCFGRSGGSWRESNFKQAAGFALWLVTLAVLLGWVTP